MLDENFIWASPEKVVHVKTAPAPELALVKASRLYCNIDTCCMKVFLVSLSSQGAKSQRNGECNMILSIFFELLLLNQILCQQAVYTAI